MRRDDTSSAAAKSFARRWVGLVSGFKPPSTPKALEVKAAFRDAMNDAGAAVDLPFNPAIFAFAATITRGMKARGEL